MDDELTARIYDHLVTITRLAPGRPPGSEANRHATDYVARVLDRAGWPVAKLPFETTFWMPGPARIVVDGEAIDLDPPPFCRPGRAMGTCVEVASDAELNGRGAPADNRILVLRGDLAQPLFPKAFPFVKDPDQMARIAALEAATPEAVVAVVYDETVTEPVFEDPDLAFIYATLPVAAATGLREGASVELDIGGSLEQGDAANVSGGATTGARVVLCAHLDSKVTTVGALDNASGVATLLALAEMGAFDSAGIELVFFNGEDHYNAPGEQAWLAAGGLDDVQLVVNVDGAGLRGYPAAVSTIGVEGDVARAVAQAIERTDGVVAGEPWFESDHAVFAMSGIPSIAITSGAPHEDLKRSAHLREGDLERVDAGGLAAVARYVKELLSAVA